MMSNENNPKNESEKDGNTKVEGNETQQEELNTSTDAASTENVNAEAKTSANPLEEKIIELEAKLREEKDRFLRLYSEFDNAKKRHMRERTDLLKYAGEDVYKLILPVLDDFERAMKANETADDITAVKEGFQLIFNKMKNNLTGKGLEEMKCTGELFNSDSMEAVANIPAPSDDLKSKVVDVLEKGYLLNGKVIRFAKVVVGN